jgi:hypothetical protein
MTSRLTAFVASLGAGALLVYMVVALPTRLMLSDYVHVPGGLEPFVGGLLALALAMLAVARVAADHDRAAAAVLRVCGVAAVLTAAYPTDATRATVVTLSGQIHRHAAFVLFAGLPVAAGLLVRHSATRASLVVRTLVALSASAVVLTLLLHPSSPVQELISMPGWAGGAERLAAALNITLVAVLALVTGPAPAAAARVEVVDVVDDLGAAGEHVEPSRVQVAA